MYSIFESELRKIDKKMEDGISLDIPSLFKKIPLEIFSELSLGVPGDYPNIKKWFPLMPSDEVQNHWTGNFGNVLLGQSIEFVKTLISGFSGITNRNLTNLKVLDFGCGWGRIIRLLYKYISDENIYAVDPWDESIRMCKEKNLKGNFSMIDYLPKSLPFNEKFDLIFAFSVFTHLSEKAALIAMDTLRKYISDDGVLVMTIRPKEYWTVLDKNNNSHGGLAKELIQRHDQYGFAFRSSDYAPDGGTPLDSVPVDGIITYGDASMTFKYIENNFLAWEIISVEWNTIDPLQIIVFLKPV
jgi:SAM-dependent methyltransferase